MDSQYLFNKTLEELKSRIKSTDQYDILMTSGLLRKLLLDGGDSLINQINKGTTKVKFRVNLREPIRIRFPDIIKNVDSYMWVAREGINPDIADQRSKDYNPKLLNLEEFLKCPVAFNKQSITIKDLIKFLSNKEGGVHKEIKNVNNEKEIKNILLREMDSFLGFNGMSNSLNILRDVCVIVLRDLSYFKKD